MKKIFRVWDELEEKMIYIADDSIPIKDNLMQWVFLEDMDQVKIYEKDIIILEVHTTINLSNDYTDTESIDQVYKGTVTLTSRGAILKVFEIYNEITDKYEYPKKMYKQVVGERSKVIGNVFENPEIIKGVRQ